MNADFQSALACQQEGKLEEAAAAYQRVRADDPDYFKAQNNLGLLCERGGRLDDAERAYRNAISQNADAEILHYNLARVLHQTNRLIEALASYHKAIDGNPQWAEPVYNAAIAYHQQERYATAETFYRRTLELAPQMPAAHRYLGDLLFEVGRHEEALASYRRALELDPNQPSAYFNLGKTLFLFGCFEEAEAAYRQSLALAPNSNAVYSNLVALLRRTGQPERALEVVQEWLAAYPDNPVARHTWAALAGDEAPDHASQEYVSQLFDEFAATFDSTLSKLDYKVPELTARALRDALPGKEQLDILDAGCGTGRCGPLVRQLAARLSGVDLSRGMLEKAHLLRIYDELVQEELTVFLRSRPAAFDAIISADTLVYFGALEAPLAAAAGALRPGGVFVFSLEQSDSPEDWQLGPHGRYCHSRAYLEQALSEAGLQACSIAQGDLRTEGEIPVRGWIVTAQLAGQA